jgi:hypothetical protein
VTRNYWLNLFSEKTWQEFLDAGAGETGFRMNRWTQVQRVAPGDYFLCYLTGASRFIGLLEAKTQPFRGSEKRIWSEEDFPARIGVNALVTLSPTTGVPIHDVLDELSIYDPKRPNQWSGRVRGSPSLWKAADGELVTRRLLAASADPVETPIPEWKRRRMGTTSKTARSKDLGMVTIPDSDQNAFDNGASEVSRDTEEVREARSESAHTEIQWRLLKLGSDMGLDVWVARNDGGRVYQGNRFAELPRLRKDIPRQFDEATNSTIELIDVLWLKRNAIVAAFEIESTTSIYSGLLRMSDLIAMQPNINIPLYIVAPDERRDKVKAEITRPTFSRMTPPLRTVCRYVSFSALRERLPAENVVRYLSPEFVENELSETFDA